MNLTITTCHIILLFELRGVSIRGAGRGIAPRRHLVPEGLDQASAEVGAALGTLAASGAILYGIATLIRDANGFDARDKALMAARLGTLEPETTAAPIPEPTALPEREAVTPAAHAAVETGTAERVSDVKSWIASWKEKQEKKRGESSGTAVETPVVESMASVEVPVAAVVNDNEIQERVKETRDWISNWKEKSVEAAQQFQDMVKEDVGLEQRVTDTKKWIQNWKENVQASNQKIEAIEATTMISEMTSDAPVGIQVEETEASSEPSASEHAVTSEKEVVMATHSGNVVLDDEVEGFVERESNSTRSTVRISEQYQAKIESLWASYENMKQRNQVEARSLGPRETVTVDPVEIDEAQKKQASSQKNPIVALVIRLIAFVQACFEFIKSLLFGAHNNNSNAKLT